MISKRTKRGVTTLSIYGFLVAAFFILNALFPGGRFAPDLGIFVFWFLLIYTPIAFTVTLVQFLKQDKSKLISLIIHGVFILITLFFLYQMDFRIS